MNPNELRAKGFVCIDGEWFAPNHARAKAHLQAAQLELQESVKEKREFWSEAEIKMLEIAYGDPLGFTLKTLADIMNRTEAAIACKANDLGLCSPRGKYIRTKETLKNYSLAQKQRVQSPEEMERFRQQAIEFHKHNPHPKGFLGKHHTQEARDRISKANTGRQRPIQETIAALKTRLANYGTLTTSTRRGTWKASWQTIGGVRKFYRSKWESNYARYLEFQKQHGLIAEWEHEPDTFWFDGVTRGCVSYKPDFRVLNTDGQYEYHEVKGWMDADSKTKILRMAKYHPGIVLKVFDSKWYKANSRRLSKIIIGWE